MTRRLLCLTPLALSLLAVTACSNASPTAPTAPPPATQILQGSWSGTITTPNGEASVRMTMQSRLEGDVERATGTYESRIGGASTTGDVTAVNLLGVASILLTPTGPVRCPVDASNASAGSLLFGARPDGNRLSGTGTWTLCAVSTAVPVVLTKG